MKVMLCLVSSSVLPEKYKKYNEFSFFYVSTIYLMIVNKKINNETRFKKKKNPDLTSFVLFGEWARLND